jgi:hypothetical protein
MTVHVGPGASVGGGAGRGIKTSASSVNVRHAAGTQSAATRGAAASAASTVTGPSASLSAGGSASSSAASMGLAASSGGGGGGIAPRAPHSQSMAVLSAREREEARAAALGTGRNTGKGVITAPDAVGGDSTGSPGPAAGRRPAPAAAAEAPVREAVSEADTGGGDSGFDTASEGDAAGEGEDVAAAPLADSADLMGPHGAAVL